MKFKKQVKTCFALHWSLPVTTGISFTPDFTILHYYITSSNT